MDLDDADEEPAASTAAEDTDQWVQCDRWVASCLAYAAAAAQPSFASRSGAASTMLWATAGCLCRCKVWRVVPDRDWEDVQTDERESWLCEYAAWDLLAAPPHKPACKRKG